MDPDANAPLGSTTVGGSRGARYELLGRLAVGGMAELYLARTTSADGQSQVVVLKRILPHLAEDPEFVRMFRDEAYLAATLQHPNIVRVFDIGRHREDYFFTMEYVHGENLRAILRAAQKRGEQIPLQHVLSIGIGVTSALHYAHEQVDTDGNALKIVHRDVSPTNVLVSVDGAVKIVDFGIAKAAAGTHVTQAGMLKGKASYMSPEQCRAEGVDRRSDVFAIGILLFEMTTLTRLFKGDNELAILHQVLTGNVPPPSSRRPEYPPQLESIVLRALQNNPEERYQTALELQRDLEAFARAQDITASAPGLAGYLHDLFGPKPVPWNEPKLASPPPEESSSGLETTADRLGRVDETDLTRHRDNRTPAPRPLQAVAPSAPAEAKVGPRSPSTPARRTSRARPGAGSVAIKPAPRPKSGAAAAAKPNVAPAKPNVAPAKPAVSTPVRTRPGPKKPAAAPQWTPGSTAAASSPKGPRGSTLQHPSAPRNRSDRPTGPSPIQQQAAAPKSPPASPARVGLARGGAKSSAFKPAAFSAPSAPAAARPESRTDAPTSKRTAPLGTKRTDPPSPQPVTARPGPARTYQPPVPSLDYPASGVLQTQVSSASSDVAAVTEALRVAHQQQHERSSATAPQSSTSPAQPKRPARPALAFTPPTPEFDMDDDGGGQTQVAPPSDGEAGRGAPSVEKTQVAQAIDKDAILAAAAQATPEAPRATPGARQGARDTIFQGPSQPAALGGAGPGRAASKPPSKVDRTMVATRDDVRAAVQDAMTTTAPATPALTTTALTTTAKAAPATPDAGSSSAWSSDSASASQSAHSEQPMLRTQPMAITSASVIEDIDLAPQRRTRWPLIVVAAVVPLLAGAAAFVFWPRDPEPEDVPAATDEVPDADRDEATEEPTKVEPDATARSEDEPSQDEPADDDEAEAEPANPEAKDDAEGEPGTEDPGAAPAADTDAGTSDEEPEPEPESEPEPEPESDDEKSPVAPDPPKPERSKPKRSERPKPSTPGDDEKNKPTPFPSFGPGSTIPP